MKLSKCAMPRAGKVEPEQPKLRKKGEDSNQLKLLANEANPRSAKSKISKSRPRRVLDQIDMCSSDWQYDWSDIDGPSLRKSKAKRTEFKRA